MFEPEYRVGFQILREKIGLGPTLGVVVPAVLKSFISHYAVLENNATS